MPLFGTEAKHIKEINRTGNGLSHKAILTQDSIARKLHIVNLARKKDLPRVKDRSFIKRWMRKSAPTYAILLSLRANSDFL